MRSIRIHLYLFNINSKKLFLFVLNNRNIFYINIVNDFDCLFGRISSDTEAEWIIIAAVFAYDMIRNRRISSCIPSPRTEAAPMHRIFIELNCTIETVAVFAQIISNLSP